VTVAASFGAKRLFGAKVYSLVPRVTFARVKKKDLASPFRFLLFVVLDFYALCNRLQGLRASF
jgi:hypothetical protein